MEVEYGMGCLPGTLRELAQNLLRVQNFWVGYFFEYD
jgi:hypothetical protein